ncbi:MAG: hypothetical protein AAGJ97_13220 [Planctomycetota bacterium]
MPDRPRSRRSVRRPRLTVTRYDRAVSGLLAAVFSGLLVCAFLSVVWASVHVADTRVEVPLELISLSGGVEDGDPDDDFESADASEQLDPTIAPESEDPPVDETLLEAVVSMAEEVADRSDLTADDQPVGSARAGGGEGDGRPLGSGSGVGGLTREQRWFISFDDGGSLETYAVLLDRLGIELGVLRAGGVLTYVANLSGDVRTRDTKSGGDETRLYMTWQAGELQKADRELLAKIGLRTTSEPLFHFYPEQTEIALARAEFAHKNVEPDQIRRTYFVVRPEGDGYELDVRRQTYFTGPLSR